jgi:hypothetical protein
MSQVAEYPVANKLEARAYATNWEHLSEELRCLDLRLHSQVLRQRPDQPADPLAPFTGLVLSQSEILGILTTETNIDGHSLDSTTAAQQQDLTQAATRLENEIEEHRAASLRAGIYLALSQLAQLFHLTRFEEKCVLLCLAPELHRKY